MNETCKTSLRFIDGKPAPAFCMSECSYELLMYKKYGYTMLPKEDVISITKQDLVDHPEKFKPFIYSPFLENKYSTIVESKAILYNGDKWIFNNPWSNGTIFGNWSFIEFAGIKEQSDENILRDVIYIEKYYPKLYKKLLQDNGLPETYSQIKESGYIDSSEKQIDIGNSNEPAKGKPHHVATPIITPEQVNAEINYTHISESSDLKL